MDKKYFYPNGTIRTIERYKNGKLHGEILLYWPNGNMKRRLTFENGVRVGKDEFFDEMGNLQDVDQYVHGKRI